MIFISQHKLLRKTLTGIFLLAAVLVGSFIFDAAPSARAVTAVNIQTGYYVGSGAAQSITGLGFAPQLLIIKADTNTGSAVWKSSSMPAGEYAYWGSATADNSENQLSLDADGFTVQVAGDVNTASVRYTYIAFSGSDCSSSGLMCIGSYAGNGSTQDVATGFQPDLVWTKRTTALAAYFRTSMMATNNSSSLTNLVDDISGFFTTINSSSFTVGGTNSTTGGLYYFAAFKASSSTLAVGTYVGTGVTGKSVSGFGFRPNFALTKPNAATVPGFNLTHDWGDFSSVTGLTGNATGIITALQSDGFTVGTSASSNTSLALYQFFAFGGAPALSPSGSFTMRRGSYSGTGVARSVTGIGFSPDLVIIKSDNSADNGVWSTSLNNNLTHYFTAATAGFAGGITGMAADGFAVGTNSTVNTNGITYEYIAFGNATTPTKGAHAADFFIGAYTGNAIDGRAIDNLAFTPDMVAVKQNSTQVAAWRSSVMPTNTSATFSLNNDDTTGAVLKTLDSTGFTLGTSALSNATGVLYHFFGFKKGATTFNVGSYSGTGVSKNITGLGFNPDFVWVKSTSTPRGVMRTTSPTITGLNSQYFTNLANIATAITGFVADGFSIATGGEVNTNANLYRWAAWKSPSPTAAPNSPTNSAPAASATAVDLNATLTSSAYSDSGGNSQTDAQWQVDDESDFSSPVWTRTAGSAEATTAVTSGNGTFANELAGLSELDHAAVYYWRVRHSNGLYSGWSNGTSFTTNIIQAPTNSTPADGDTVQSLTPALSASAFSDAQGGHTAASANWQIDVTNAFTSPFYDSGNVGYSASFAVPTAILSNLNRYYWRVRYKDSSGRYSAFSAATRFTVSQTSVAVKPLFTNTVVDQGDSINIDTQVALTDGTAVNDATVSISIYNPAGTKIVNAASVTYISGSNGVYRYTYTVPSANGSYLYEVTATSNSVSGYGAGNFQTKTISSDITSLASAVSTIGSNVASILSSMAALISEIGTGNIAAIKTKTDTITWANITSILTTAGDIKTKTDDIAWSDISAIKTKTDTISWSDVTGIKLKTDTITWGDITTIKTNVATLITEIGTGNISAIKTKTDTINWTDITGIVTSEGEIKAKTDTIDWANVTAIKTKTDTISWSDVTGIKVKTDTIDWSDVTDTKTAVESIQSNLDVLIGALIVTQSSVNDSSPSTSLFVTSLVNATDNFYKNAVLTFTSGSLKGQSRRISAYTGSTKAIRLDPALTSAPGNGDTFTIVAQNVRAEELAVDIASTTSDTNTRVRYIQTKVDAINSLLNAVDTKLDTAQSNISLLRSSQQGAFNVELEGSPTVATETTYRAKIVIADYLAHSADASSTPTITIYDAGRSAVVSAASMTRLSTGVYEYTYSVSASADSGLWESVVTVPFGAASQVRSQYWTVTGAPAQVKINSMTSLTVPNIAASVTITNEGTADQEYQYQWCVVSNQSDACNSPSVIAVSSAAKLIHVGEDFSPILSLTVPHSGDYWFKLVVTFGGQTSAASLGFRAVNPGEETPTTTPVTSSTGTGGGTPYGGPTTLDSIRAQLELNAIQMAKVLGILGNVDPKAAGFSSIISVNAQNTSSIKDIQNKVAELKAISASVHQIANQGSADPVIQTYMKFNSVELHFLITNPDVQAKTVHFKALLPEEVRPEYVMASDGLAIEYDATAKAYYAAGDIMLKAGASVTKKVEIKDIWVFTPEQLSAMAVQTHSLAASLSKTQLGAQATLLESEVNAKIASISSTQLASYDSPENHIVVYRDNKVKVDQIMSDIGKLKDLVVQSGASQGLLGSIGGIQTFGTWGIIIFMIIGFTLMAGIIISMWRHQTALAELTLRHEEERLRQGGEPIVHPKRSARARPRHKP